MKLSSDPERSKLFANLGLVASFVAAILLFGLVTYVGERENTFIASVVANVEQVGEGKSPENLVQVRLPSGVVVNAKAPANSGYPFQPGTPVRVTAYRGRFFGLRNYRLDP